MTQLRVFGLTLVSILAYGIALSATASAAVLPDMHLLPEGKSSTAKGSAGKVGSGKKIAFLETEAGSKLTAEEVKATVKVEGLAALGPFEMDIVGISLKAGETCETVGDPEGVTLLQGEYHLVFTSLKTLRSGDTFLIHRSRP